MENTNTYKQDIELLEAKARLDFPEVFNGGLEQVLRLMLRRGYVHGKITNGGAEHPYEMGNGNCRVCDGPPKGILHTVFICPVCQANVEFLLNGFCYKCACARESKTIQYDSNP